ncbi:class I SAM-dependent methyltransferase [Rubellimicrobium aerolatum]|uniref:Class I SAM-dependent methyltransferase n=1 Tax=Rubellimicrobium aerolatum TaxID=490979 RepID=A0ABW0SBU8_9RHOB|nr:methyltransferase domain-containing protein [Rubellimicrobium aerolatum]MBP1805925.1 SAM-dependent methyltransferase [Rubellimicrobium aerolatum]
MANEDQAEFWNGEVGRLWTVHERALEGLTAEVSDLLLGRAASGPGERVLEVGCGGGALSVRLARAVAPGGSVLGLDISGPLLARAEARRAAEGVTGLAFRRDDAQVAALPPAGFDLVASQFGSMFFADPVAAFRNLRGALRPGGRMVLVAWGPLSGNPFFTLARDAAVRRVGPPVEVTPAGAPGPFAFADAGRVVGLLEAAGFAEVRGEGVALRLHPPGGAEEVAGLATSLGPAVRILAAAEATEADRRAVREELAAAYRAFATPEGIRIPSVVNLFDARA